MHDVSVAVANIFHAFNLKIETSSFNKVNFNLENCSRLIYLFLEHSINFERKEKDRQACNALKNGDSIEQNTKQAFILRDHLIFWQDIIFKKRKLKLEE